MDDRTIIMKKYLVIEHHKFKTFNDDWTIKYANVDEDTAFTKMVALRTLNENEDRERYSHYLQEVDKGMLPLVLTNEVVEEQSELPF